MKIYNLATLISGLTEEVNRQENIVYGGPRFCTFMIYLSDVEAGGRTVFPTIGLSVQVPILLPSYNTCVVKRQQHIA
jgi:hypothetical protein